MCFGPSRGGGDVNTALQRAANQVSYSAAMCVSNLPSGLQSVTTFANSSAVKSGPAGHRAGAFAADLQNSHHPPFR